MVVLGDYFNKYFGVHCLTGRYLQEYENGRLTRDDLKERAAKGFWSLLGNIITRLEECRTSQASMDRPVAKRFPKTRIDLYSFFARTMESWQTFIENRSSYCHRSEFSKLERWTRFIPTTCRSSILYNLVRTCLERNFCIEADGIISKNRECFFVEENIEKWINLMPSETRYKVLIDMIKRYLKLKDYGNALKIVEENARSFKENSTQLKDFIQIETLLANEDEFRVLEELSKCLPVAFRYRVFVYFIRKCLREKLYERLISLLKNNNDKKFVEFIHENEEKSKDLNTNLFYVIEATFENFKKESDALEIIDLCRKFPCFSDEDLERINSWKKIVRTRFSS